MSEVILKGLSEENLVSRAIRNARLHRRGRYPRWVAVAKEFDLNKALARELCQMFGYDPSEVIS